MTKTQLRALEVLYARIDPKNPKFAGTPEIAKALTEANFHFYMDTWVYSLLEALIDDVPADQLARSI